MEITKCAGAELSLLKEEKVLSWQDVSTGQFQAVLEVALRNGRTGQAGWRCPCTASQHRAETDAKPGLLPFHLSHVEGSNCVQGTSLPRWKNLYSLT